MKHLLILIILFAFTLTHADSELDQAKKAAELGFKDYMSKATTPRGIKDLNIKDLTTIKNATLGEPIEIMELTPAAIVNYKQGEGVSKLLTPYYSLWVFISM